MCACVCWFINSHRSDISKSEVSIGEEIEEVSIEGPENSDKVVSIPKQLGATLNLCVCVCLDSEEWAFRYSYRK